MEFCFACRSEMGQTDARCSNCGHCFAAAKETTLTDLLIRQSSLRDMFLFMTVLGCPLALTYYFAPNWISNVPNQPDRWLSSTYVFLLGLCCYFSGWVLHDAAPLWSRLFNFFGILTLASWPMFGW